MRVTGSESLQGERTAADGMTEPIETLSEQATPTLSDEDDVPEEDTADDKAFSSVGWCRSKDLYLGIG